LKRKYQDGVKSQIISHTLDDSYYRMVAGKNKLPIPPVRPKKRFFIFDKDFFNPYWEDIIDNIIERNPASIVTIHPIICNTLTQYFGIRNKAKVSRQNELILDLNIPLSEVYYMLKHYKNKFLADVMTSSNVYLTLGGDFRYSIQYFENFIYKLNLLYSFWSCDIPIKIKYLQPKLGFIDPLPNISRLVETWSCGATKKTKSLAERTLICASGRPTPARKERDLILEKYPNVKDLFNQTYTTLSNRGFWRV